MMLDLTRSRGLLTACVIRGVDCTLELRSAASVIIGPIKSPRQVRCT
jgi:hypothetical protein